MFPQQKKIIRPALRYSSSEYLLQCEALSCYFFIIDNGDRRNHHSNSRFNVMVNGHYHWNVLEIKDVIHYHNAATLIKFNPSNTYQAIYITQPLNTTFFARLILTNNQCLLLTPLSPSLEVYRNLAISFDHVSNATTPTLPTTLAYDTFVNGLNVYIDKRRIKLLGWVAKCTLLGHGLIYLSGITHTFPQTCLIEINQNCCNYFFVHFHSTRSNLIETKKIAAFLNNRFSSDFCEYMPHLNTNTSRTLCFSIDSIKKHWDSIVHGLDQVLSHVNEIKKTASKSHPFFARNYTSVLPSTACPLDSSVSAATEMTGSSAKHFK